MTLTKFNCCSAGILLSLLAMLVQAENSLGKPEVTSNKLINVSPYSQLAIHAYDPVAYFVDGKATPGDRSIVTIHNGIRWAFANKSNQQLFVDSPEAFIPQYGGHCAYAASRDAIADADPEAWQIVDGKLYLNYDNRVQRVWANQLVENVKLANRHWPELETDALRKLDTGSSN